MPPEDSSPAHLVALRDARERVIAQLSDAFASGAIEVEEFERRVTLAHRAESVADLLPIASDLSPTAAEAPAVVVAPQPQASLAREAKEETVLAIFGGVERRGAWRLPRSVRAVAVMGGMVFDFRDAVFQPGVTEIEVLALMGGVQLIVPPSLAVEVSGTAIFGGFGHVERTPAQPDPDRPLLRVRGLALFGGVAVETRLPGESDQDAARRRRAPHGALGAGHEPKRLGSGR
jgi:hypothetical protein